MNASRVVSAVPVIGARVSSKVQRLCYKAGMALITLSGNRGSRAWADQVERARKAERDFGKAMDSLHEERRRGNQLFTSCTLAVNLLADGRHERAAEQLRLAVIAGRRKP